MSIRIGCRSEIKTSNGDFGNVTVENFVEYSGDLTDGAVLSALDAAAKSVDMTIFDDDGSFSLVKAQKTLTALNYAELKNHKKTLMRLPRKYVHDV